MLRTLLIALAQIAFAASTAAAGQILREKTSDFTVNAARLKQGDVQAFVKLNSSAIIPETVARLLGSKVMTDASITQLFEMKASLKIQANYGALEEEKFWDFSNLGDVFPDITFSPVDRNERAGVSYPVREMTFGMIPDHLDCQLTQKRITPENPLFKELWNEFKPAVLKAGGEPSLAVVQTCTGFNMMFRHSMQTMFFVKNANTVDMHVLSRYYIKKETVRTINSIPFMNAESKISGTLLKEIDAFRGSLETFLKR